MPVGETDDKVLTRSSNPSHQARPTSVVTGNRSELISKQSPPYPSSRLILKHIAALEIKRFHHSKRNRKGLLCEIVMPSLFVCLAMTMTLILPGLSEEPALEISPWIYPTKVQINLSYILC